MHFQRIKAKTGIGEYDHFQKPIISSCTVRHLDLDSSELKCYANWDFSFNECKFLVLYRNPSIKHERIIALGQCVAYDKKSSFQILI